jgi:serine O-acetyltransferase
MRFIEVVKKDYKAHSLKVGEPSFKFVFYRALIEPKFRVILRMRLANRFSKGNFWLRAISRFLYNINLKRGVDIHPLATIGPGLRMAHPLAIVIGKDALLGSNVRVMQGVTIGGNAGKTSKSNKSETMPFVDDYCLVGGGCCVLGPITIGKGAVLGANSVVIKDVKPWSINVGLPSKEIGKISSITFEKFHYLTMVSSKELK